MSQIPGGGSSGLATVCRLAGCIELSGGNTHLLLWMLGVSKVVFPEKTDVGICVEILVPTN